MTFPLYVRNNDTGADNLFQFATSEEREAQKATYRAVNNSEVTWDKTGNATVNTPSGAVTWWFSTSKPWWY